ncbi:D-aspartate oxidase [Paxillus involutus ATCC 200175]|uniref:D-aspartate oxidase n=1 Tax=Paxillus involutus ATCC 200175 TaxID=664439 RepID=A0A0C9TWH3_PAXIN|nr:D-aspartate oxidase [Paxillus involutus ATCC 200175]
MSDEPKQIIVIGAGVVGLSTAIKIQERGGYRVTIVAETFPTDPRTIRYTSHWAGAHHVSQAFGDVRQKAMDKETFEVMWRDSEPKENGAAAGYFFRHNQTEFRADGVDPSPWLDYMPEFRAVSEDDLIANSTAGWTFTTFTINTPVYLNWLLARFLAGGGTTKRVQLQHISQVFDSTQNPAAIVACPGIGARFLGGIEDKNIYPIRGQTILLRAPWVKYGRSLSGADGSYAYFMPRCTGDVLMGGIIGTNDWNPVPSAEDREIVLTRALALSADLAPPSIRATREPTIEDLRPLIIDEGCGLRPGRKGGIRLEVEWIDSGTGEGQEQRKRIPVVYNYGHSGMGFQSSWGSASIALGLLEDALENGEQEGGTLMPGDSQPEEEAHINVAGN